MRYRSHGWTLIEVLVVITIISILLAILLPVISRVREHARRSACARNLQQASAALNIYANSNHGKLPQHTIDHATASFPHQLPIKTADALVRGESSRDMLYCPSGDLARDNAWWDQATMCATGYTWLIRRAQGGPPPLNPPKQYQTSLAGVRDHANVEVAVDTVVSFKGSFTGLDPFGVGDKLRLLPNRSSHLRGDKPTGGNVLFLDGHVVWRPINEMSIRGGPNELWF
jgi:prepilin-type N-terminal cleavage/methylation domain-containing protein/prepilin-type processing-associated H-X9-DG protein